MILAYCSGAALGCCLTFITLKTTPISRKERINATLETIVELQELFGQVTDGGKTYDKLDDVRLVVKGMQKR